MKLSNLNQLLAEVGTSVADIQRNPEIAYTEIVDRSLREYGLSKLPRLAFYS